MGHAKALLTAKDPVGLLQELLEKRWSVRETEKQAITRTRIDSIRAHAQEMLEEKLGTRVRISQDRIVIDYYGLDDLQRLLNHFGIDLC